LIITELLGNVKSNPVTLAFLMDLFIFEYILLSHNDKSTELTSELISDTLSVVAGKIIHKLVHISLFIVVQILSKNLAEKSTIVLSTYQSLVSQCVEALNTVAVTELEPTTLSKSKVAIF
jgi:hypothetical protein